MLTKTMYNLHFLIENDKVLHVVTYRIKDISSMNSCHFFLAEHEEKKNCLYWVETANAGMGL